MARGQYRGVSGVARKVVKEYRGVSGVARKVTKAYRGVSGIARQYFGYPMTVNFVTGVHAFNGVTNYITLDDSFAGAVNGTWRLYVKATNTMPDNGNSSVGSNDNRAYARVYIRGYDFVGKTITITYTPRDAGAYMDHTLVYHKFNGAAQHQTLPSSSSAMQTHSYTIPDNTAYISFDANTGLRGTHSIELIIHALSIGDEVIL